MAERLGDAVLELRTDDTGLDEGIDRARAKAEGLQGAFDRTGDKLISLGGTMTKTVSGPIAAVGAGMAALATKTANTGNEIAKTARSVGMNAQSFQELGFALSQVSDVTESEVQRSFQQLNQNLGKAEREFQKYLAVFPSLQERLKAGAISQKDFDKALKEIRPGQTAEEIKALGFSMEELASGSVSSEAVVMALTEQLGETRTAAEAAEKASAILGTRVGRSLGPQLRETGGDVARLRGEFRELGLGMGQEALDSSEKFVDQMDVLGRQFQAASVAVAAQLMPVFTEKLAPWLIDVGVPAIISMGQAIGGVIEWFGNLPGPVQEAVGVLAVALGAGGPVLIALGIMAKAFAAIIAVATGPIGLFIGAAVLAAAAWAQWGDQIKETIGAALDWLSNKFAGFTEAMSAVTDRIAGAWSWLKETLVGNSIIPDMWVSIEEWFERGGQSIADKTSALARETADNFGSMAHQATSHLAEMAGALSTHSKAMFRVSKIAGIAQAIISTHQGIAAALKLGWPLGPIAAAKIGAMGFAQVAALRGASMGGGGGSNAGLGGLGAVGFPDVPEPSAREDQGPRGLGTIVLQGHTFDRRTVEELVERINDLSADGLHLRVQRV